MSGFVEDLLVKMMESSGSINKKGVVSDEIFDSKKLILLHIM